MKFLRFRLYNMRGSNYMCVDEKFQTSKYLRIVPREGDVAVYHSLLGGLSLVDANITHLLNIFHTPQNALEAHTVAPYFSKEQVRSFIATFKSKGFLVYPGCNEYDVIQQKIDQTKESLHKGSQIGVIQLVVTNNCNFKCSYCFINQIYASEKRYASQVSPLNRLMSPEMARIAIENVIKVLKESGKGSLWIQFFGGEPLLNWKTIKFVLEHFEKGDKYGIEINYSIVTNGALFNHEIATYFLKYNVPIVISFDSPRGNERFLLNGKNAFPVIKRSLTILNKNGNRIIFNTVLSKETFDFFDTALVDFALKNGVYEIGVLFDLDPIFYELENTSDIVNKLWDMYIYGNSKGVVVTGYWHMIFQKMVAYDHFKYNSFKTCSATGCQLSIEPSGDVFACKASSGYFGRIGEVYNLLLSDTYKEYTMRAFRNAPECDGCEIENFCSGFCLGPLEKIYGTIQAIEKRTCDVYRELTRKLILNVEKNGIENYQMPPNTPYLNMTEEFCLLQ